MNFKEILSKAAPFLGGLVGGPFGATAGSLVGKLLLGNDNATPEALAEAVQSATPDQLIRLREIDADERLRMAELSVDTEKIHHEDRESARRMQLGARDWMPSALGILLTGGYFGVIAVLIFCPIQPDAKEVMYTLVGGLSTCLAAVINFYFGSSSGSQRKDDMIYKSKPL